MEKVINFALDGWTLGPTHGISHWQRVERNGILLARHANNPEINLRVVRCFAYLHDKWREDDGWDLLHGPRASEMIPTIRNTILSHLTEDEVQLLRQACQLHTSTQRTGNPTIDTCFDADRLDLGRVGITPEPQRMATPAGSYLAHNLHLLEQEQM